MIKEIKYNGYTASPSDLPCPDGDLATAINVIQEDGSLRPIHKPKEMFGLTETQEILFIHKDSDFCNYIIRETSTDGKVSFLPHNGTKASSAFLTLEDGEEYVDINAIGRILVVSTSLHLHYIRYKDGKYIYLGTQVPDVRMKFKLKSNLIEYIYETQLTFDETASAESSYEAYENKTIEVQFNYTGTVTVGYAFAVLDYALEKGIEYYFEMVGGYVFQIEAIYSNETDLVGHDPEYYRGVEIFDSRSSDSAVVTQNTQILRLRIQTDNPVQSQKRRVTISVRKGLTTAAYGEQVLKYTSENYEAVMGAANKFVAKYGSERNRFIYPFFVRYALRLADGSYARISDPILMIPNAGNVPFITFSSTRSKELLLYAFSSVLRYQFEGSIPSEWEGIIAGVDVYASSPVFSYDQGQAYDDTKHLMTFSHESAMKGKSYSYSIVDNGSMGGDLYERAKSLYEYDNRGEQKQYYNVSIAEKQNRIKELLDVANFYLIASFSTSDIYKNDFQSVVIAKGVLSTLTNQQTLDDEMYSRYTFKNAHLASYNQRLHLFDYTQCYPEPQSPFSTVEATFYVHLSVDGETKTIKGNCGYYNDQWYKWFFFPHNNAKSLTIYLRDTITEEYKVVSLTLSQHPLLNGSYWLSTDLNETDEVFESWEDIGADSYTETVDDMLHRPASIRQSPVNAPFTFPASLANDVGAQRILNISSAAKALSQGQFGQFPLYAFTTEGVWALEVASTGAYSSKQPISRDVCITPEAITQLDSEVIFPTDRGLMLIRGSEVSCVSDSINSETPFDISKLPCSGVLHKMLGHSDTDDDCVKLIPFSEYLSQCRMMYDYSHQRIFVYAPGKNYAYVYSLKSQTWGMTDCRIKYGTNYYPEAIAVDMDNKVVNFSSFDGEAEQKAKVLYITRPLKLDAPFLYKTIDTLIQRGDFERFDIGSILYGSRDMINWFVVWSSKDHTLRGFRGTGYKYFRIAGIGELDSGEMVYGASIQFEPRETNLLR